MELFKFYRLNILQYIFMNRSQMGSSRVLALSLPQRIDRWATSIRPNHLEENIQSTVALLKNVNTPIAALHLILEKLSQIQTSAFTEILKSVIDEVEVLCQNAMISNLRRISEGKSIFASTANLLQDVEERNLYRGSLILLNLIQQRAQKAHKAEALSKLKICVRGRQKSEPDVEDNKQLMKFFQGVRRYQDHQDRLGIQALQKLRAHKDLVLRNKAMTKGFELSKLQKQLNHLFQKPKRLLFLYYRRTRQLHSLSSTVEILRHRLLRGSFSHMLKVMKRKTIHELFNSYRDLQVRRQLVHISKQLRLHVSRKMNKRSSLRRLQMLFQSRQTSYQHSLMSYLKSRPKLRHQRLGNLFIRLSDLFLAHQKRRCLRRWACKLPSRLHIFTNRIKSILFRRIDHALFKIQSRFVESRRPILSARAKGKIVASLIRVKHEDVNLRKSFLKWLLKAKPEAVEKKFMHLFLYARTRPFTYFLRLKHLCRQNMRTRVNAKSLLFVLLLKQKSLKFLKYKMKDAVQKWYQWNGMCKLIFKMEKHLSKLRDYSNEALVKYTFRWLLQLFDEFNSRKRIMMRFFNAIGGTGVGKVFKAIDIWKKLPDNKEIKKKQMMLATINKALHRIRHEVRLAFQQFKNCYLEGEERKRAAALVMIKATGGSVQQSFKKWEDSMRIHKTINRCRSIGLFLESVTSMMCSQYAVIFENPHQAYLREKYMGRLILAQTGNLKRYFGILENALKAARMNQQLQDKEKKLLISRIGNMVGNQSATGVKAAVQKLYINYKVKQKQVNFINRLMQTKGGKIISAIRTWKDLPEKNKFSKVRNGHKFYSILKKLADKVMISTFKPFVDIYEDGQVKKRGAVGILLSMTSSDARRYYMKWHSDTKKKRIFDQCNRTMGLMQSLTDVFRGNMMIVVESQRQVNLKEKTITRMFQNLGGGVKFFFIKWHQAAKQLTMQKRFTHIQRVQFVTVLTNGISNKKQDLVKRSVLSLHKNLRMKQIARAFFNKLMDTQAGMVIKAAQAWRNLPPKDLNKKKQRAIKFQKKLQDLAQKGIRQSFAQFKYEQLEGESKQKFILNKLVRRCMSYEQRKYIHWKAVTKELVLLQKARLLAKSFENIQSAISTPLKQSVISPAKRQLNSKEKAVSKLVKNNMSAMESALSIWKLWYNSIKATRRYRLVSRMVQIWSGKRLKQEALTNIRHDKELETQRTYINSLWRWKTSQFEAEYYNKFIQMFNESEVLLSFSKIFNSKLNSTYAWTFSRLKQLKLVEQLKYNFVKKYFTKKLASYFDRFKEELKGREIKRWKGKFQSSIRGMFMLQALQKALKKVQSYQLRSWDKRTKKYFKGKQALARVGKLATDRKELGMKFLKKNLRLCQIQLGVDILTKYKADWKQQAFNKIFKTSALMKMAGSLQRHWKQTQLNFLQHLKKYSNARIVYLQRLKRLGSLILKKKVERFRQFIASLKKRSRQRMLLTVLCQIFRGKRQESQRLMLRTLKQNISKQKLLTRLKAAQKIEAISEKIQRVVVAKYFTHWKKLKIENAWLKKSVEMMATKPSVKSSLAVSLWRMKVYAQRKNAL